MMGTFTCSLIILTLSLQCVAVIASTNNNPSPNGYSHSQNYCLNRHISFDPNSFQVDGETESINFYHDTAAADEEENVAMFFHDHYQHQNEHQYQRQANHQLKDSPSFIAMGECSFVSYLQDKMNRDEIDFDDDNDDDDDDDNDGHSSMLSNASIRKRVFVSTFTQGGGYSYENHGNGQHSSEKSSLNRSIPIMSNNGYRRRSFISTSTASPADTASPQSTSPLSKVLGVRGGATSAGSVVADEFAKRLIAAATITLLYEGMVGHILEFLKIAMQTAPVGTATYMSIIKTITEEKGLSGLWDGFVPWGIVQSVSKGGVFGLAYAIAKTYLKPFVDKGILPQQVALTMAGGIAGGFQGFVLSPLLLLKTRVMTNPAFRENMSLMKTTLLSLMIGLEVVKNEGLFALMKGADVFALKRVFDWSTRYYFSDLFQSIMLKSGVGANGVLSPAAKIAASILSGTASTIVTLPLDVIVAKSQDAKKAGVKVSAWETFIKDYNVGGMKGLYDANMMGFEARLLHVCLTTVVMQFGSPLIFDLLFGNK